MTSQADQILYIGLLFYSESKNAYVKLVISQKRIITSFKLHVNQKMLRFRKVTLGSLKFAKLPDNSTT